MSLIQQSEVQTLKEELSYLTDLISQHQSKEKYCQRPQLRSVPYTIPGAYYKAKASRPSNFNNVNMYGLKYTNASSSRNPTYKIFNNNFTQRNYSHKVTPASILHKQNSSCSVKPDVSLKGNSISNSVQKLPHSTFKIVRPSNESDAIESMNAKDAKLDKLLKPVSVLNKSEKIPSPSSEKKDLLETTSRKSAKVSYVTCSDCIIEILEYENGELHITQKKPESLVTNSKPGKKKTITEAADVKISESVLKKASQETSKASKTACISNLHSREHSSVYCKPVIGSESLNIVHNLTETSEHTEKSARSNTEKTGIKMVSMDLSSETKFIPTSSQLLNSSRSCARNAKYSKVNVCTVVKSPRQLVKNKYSVKKVNILRSNLKTKDKTNRQMKKCFLPRVKYTYVRKSLSPSVKVFPKSVAKRTLFSPAKNVQCNILASSAECYAKKSVAVQHEIPASKSIFATSSSEQISSKTKTLDFRNAYSVVNKSDSSVSEVKYNSGTSSYLSKCVQNSGKACSKNVATSSRAPADLILRQNSLGKHVIKSASKMVPYSKRIVPHKISSYKLRNLLNGSEIVSHHSLRRIPNRRTVIRKPSFDLSGKSFLKNVTSASQKARKVRLTKTNYKVVNRHVSHVSQVVQMIKTKYRTVNQRSASNSHLKWLCEQKKAHLLKKFQRTQRIPTRTKWSYCTASSELPRKHGALCSQASRKHSLKQNKVLKQIGGVTYKVSKTKIKKSVTPKTLKKNGFISSANRKNSIVLNISGTKFQMSPGRKSLRRLGTKEKMSGTPLSRIKIGGQTYVQQKESPGCLVRSFSQTQNIASRMLHRSINTVRTAQAKKTLQKNNMFCMFFNRFGRCNKEGHCRYIHDPSKIAVCTRFLRGTCKIDGCPFSHEIEPGKMAICSFFLQGNCTNNNCPYQHTSIKPGTRLCRAFAKGYCKNGSQCQDAHILACPQFICDGFCEKGSSCAWPHPPVKKVIRKDVTSPELNRENREKDTAVDDISDLRYFTYEPGLGSDPCVKPVESCECSTQQEISKIRRKIKLQKQPDFIPLHISDEEV